MQDIGIVITEGDRSFEKQNKLYAQGRTTPGKIVTYAKGGSSYHNYGLAFDFAIIANSTESWDTKVDTNENQIPDYTEVGEIGESLGLEWGGRFHMKDYPHFQLTFKLSIEELKNGVKIPEV